MEFNPTQSTAASAWLSQAQCIRAHFAVIPSWSMDDEIENYSTKVVLQ